MLDRIYFTAIITLVTLVFIRMIAPIFGFAEDPSGARKALAGQGYTNVSIGDYAWFSCGKGDFYQTKFEATGPSGVRVEGAVCSGLFWKGSTVRTN